MTMQATKPVDAIQQPRPPDWWADLIVHEAGEPRLAGTAIEVYRIAALLQGGATVDRVLLDFPSLRIEQVQAAAAYAQRHPSSRRPYPSRSVKQAFDEAQLDDLADILDRKSARS